MTGYLISSLPWFAGGLVCLALVGSPLNGQYPQNNHLDCDALPSEFLFGLGSLLGYLVWAYGLWAADQFGHTLLSAHSVIFLTLLVALASFPIQKRSLRLPIFRNLSVIHWLLILLLSVLLTVALYLQHTTPLSAWDGLDSWQANAGQFILQNLTDERGVFNSQYIKHPTTVVQIAAWEGWSMQLTNTLSWGLPWLLCMISICFMVAGFIRALTGELTLALLGAVLTATVPLAESHTLVAGYAELWLAAVVIAGLMSFGLGLVYQRKSWMFTGVTMGALTVTIKNTGPGYALCVWGALVSLSLIYRPRLTTLFLLPLGAAAYGLLVQGFLFEWAGIKVEWIPAPRYLVFAGRVMALDIFPIEQVAINELYSKLVNQSFSTTALVLFFAVCAIINSYGRTPKEAGYSAVGANHKSPANKTTGAQPLIIGALLILTMLILSQLFLPPGYEYALPERDTGNSRFSLPLILSVIPAAIVAGHAVALHRGADKAAHH